ncbi:hypothetical protein XELAEV_18037827mg [Xenopus laevis]|uniref:Uncharacterized protein n=1 Tax=Xenopus laevis TaxID=8355 RepID=A0A974CDG7_XENLA|nr:hypothetical protein XELAEV_18037827mg [Xenopus laevis]
MIPRGLRIKKFPTSLSEEFMVKWNTVLSDCSLKLMGLIVEKKSGMHIELKKELDFLRIAVDAHKEHVDFMSLNKQMETKIKQLEADIMDIKTKKYNRDKDDYEKKPYKCVYTVTTQKNDSKNDTHQRLPHSFLRTGKPYQQRSHGRDIRRGGRSKNVTKIRERFIRKLFLKKHFALSHCHLQNCDLDLVESQDRHLFTDLNSYLRPRTLRNVLAPSQIGNAQKHT